MLTYMHNVHVYADLGKYTDDNTVYSFDQTRDYGQLHANSEGWGGRPICFRAWKVSRSQILILLRGTLTYVCMFQVQWYIHLTCTVKSKLSKLTVMYWAIRHLCTCTYAFTQLQCMCIEFKCVYRECFMYWYYSQGWIGKPRGRASRLLGFLHKQCSAYILCWAYKLV